MINDPASLPSNTADGIELTAVAAAARAGIDRLLADRAPAERQAFWRAVALLYARGSPFNDPPDPLAGASGPTGEEAASANLDSERQR